MKTISFFLCLILHLQTLFAEADPSIFREYDIRGIVGEEFNIEDTPEIALAIATYFKQVDPSVRTVALGADGRIHSPAIREQMTSALTSIGFNVVNIGTCTTPVMSFATHVLPVDAGLMITASHNPGIYNGIKICLGTSSIFGAEIQKILHIYQNKTFLQPTEFPGQITSVDLISQYVSYFTSSFPHLIGADFKAILDCGNGAAGTVLPKLIEAMQWKSVELLYGDVDGHYPNHIPDPTVEKYMQDLKNALANSTADLGIAFDGDVDRMAPMTKDGRLIKGDQLLVLYSKPILEKTPGSSIVFDVSSSKFLHELILKWGGVPHISKTGIAFVKKMIADTHASLGGEISCHTVFKDRHFGFDDGIYSMIRLFELLQESGRNLKEWVAELPVTFSSPTFRLPCERSVCLQVIEVLKNHFSGQLNVEIITIDGLRLHFPNSWAIVRPSNTEPLISMRFEGRSQDDLNEMIDIFYTIINQYVDCSAMKK